MRVLFFVHRYWPAVGGVEKYIHRLAVALLEMGHQVDVVAGATTEGLAARERHEGVLVHRYPATRSPLRARWWLWRNLGLFRKADVIHVSNTHMLEYLWRMLGLMLDRRKVFLTRHGLSYIHPVPEWEKRRAVRSLGLAAGVVHDGAFIEKWLGVKPDLCPDQGLFPTADELPLIPEPPPTSATYIGRLEPDSGISIYLDAVHYLTHRAGRTFSLDVYGDGSLADLLRDRVERQRLPVRFHGRVENAQRFVSDSCFAFIDGRMAMQEAMARRRLVCAAYVDPLKRDYVGGESFSPFLASAGDGERLAQQVLRFIDGAKHRQALVQRAYDHARTLTWTRTAEAYVGLWHERLAVSRPSGSLTRLASLIVSLNRETRRSKSQWASPAPSGV